MANITKSELTYETVSGGDDSSDNNTFMEISKKYGVDYKVIMMLNPYLLCSRPVYAHNAGEDITLYYIHPVTNKVTSFVVTHADGYDHNLSLIGICESINNDLSNKYKNAIYKKLTPDDFINYDSCRNWRILASSVCMDAGDSVLVKVASITATTESFERHIFRYRDTAPRTVRELIGLLNNSDGDFCKVYGYGDAYKDLSEDDVLILNDTLGSDDYIYANDVLLFAVYAPSESTVLNNVVYGIQPDTTRTCYLKWNWDTEVNPTENYEIQWIFVTSDGEPWKEDLVATKDEKVTYVTYNPPENAVQVKVQARPVPDGKILNFDARKKATNTYEWSQEYVINLSKNIQLLVPQDLSVELNGTTLDMTAYLDLTNVPKEDNDFENPKEKIEVEFEILQDHGEFIYDDRGYYNSSKWISLSNKDGYISYSTTVDLGHTYQVRARSRRSGVYISSWSDYYNVITPPTAPTIEAINVLDATTARVSWTKIKTADSYVIQPVKVRDDLTPVPTPEQHFTDITIPKENTVTYVVADGNVYEDEFECLHANLELETGSRYYIRMQALNDDFSGISYEWSNIMEIPLGTTSIAPTAWSSSSAVEIGEPLTLYWIHNSQDSSSESSAIVKIQTMVSGENGNEVTTTEIKVTPNKTPDEYGMVKTSSYSIITNDYPNGAEIKWQVKTAGAKMENGQPVYGDYSETRTVKIFNKVPLNLTLRDGYGNRIPINDSGYESRLASFPLKLNASLGVSYSQKPISYHVSIKVANIGDDQTPRERYSIIDNTGRTRIIGKNSLVYSKFIKASELTNSHVCEFDINANDVNLVNGVSYRLSVVAAMDSGLSTDEAVEIFSTSFVDYDDNVKPLAEISYDEDLYSVSIRPYTSSSYSNYISLSVFRREYNGGFTEIKTDVKHPNEVVIDPHPPLNYAGYRIVAKNKMTGSSTFFDSDELYIGEKAVIIQWDEEWQSYYASKNAISAAPTFSGSLLKLPYNIDISNNHSIDVSHVGYIGRTRPVSYYGTQLGESATWNVEIEKSDLDTLYALRRLAAYMGDVYVREPSGSGYWATVSVSFSQKHRELTIPVTLNITPVEGGM